MIRQILMLLLVGLLSPILQAQLDEGSETANSIKRAKTSDLQLYGPAEPYLTDPGWVSAEGVDTPKELDAVLELSWQYSAAVKAAEANIAAAGFDVSGAYLGYYPSMELQAVQGESDRDTSYRLSIVQPLWDGGLTSAQVDEQKARLTEAEAALSVTKINVGNEAAMAFLELSLSQQSSREWALYIRELNLLKGLVQRRAQRGLSPPNDVELAEVRLRQAEAELARTQSQEAVARSRLRVYTGQSLFVANWPSEHMLAPDVLVTAAMKGSALAAHPQHQVALYEKMAQVAQLRAAKAAKWPKLSLQHTGFLEQQRDDFEPERSTQLVVQLQSTDLLRARRSGQGLAQRVLASEHAVAQAARVIVNEIQSAFSRRDSARQQFEAQAAAVYASELLVESNLRRFKEGRETWLAVINARREAQESRFKALKSKQDFWMANATLNLQTMHLMPTENATR
jgi:outer membrane protein TolC